MTNDKGQEFVFLGEARPVLIRMQVRVDGKPIQAAWDGFLKHLFEYLDVNGDGALSKEEAERVPSVNRLLGGGVDGIGGFGMFGRASPGPKLDALDTDKDDKVTKEELAAYYRKNNLAPFQFQLGSTQANPLTMAAAFLGGPRDPSVEAVSVAAFTLLDADKDGKLTKDELAAAPAAVLRLDEDEDETVTARELVPNPRQAGGGGAAMQLMGGGQRSGSAAGSGILVPIATAGEAPGELVRAMQERYGPKADKPEEKKLSQKDLGLDQATFGRLDANGDGVLDGAELAGFVKRPPDLELVMRLGRNEAAGAEVVTAADRPSPLAGKVKVKDGLALLDLGVTRLDVRGGEEDRPDPYGDLVRQQVLAQIRPADTNGDGIIDAKEGEANRTFRCMFKAVDRDGDGKVTEKELDAYLDKARDLQEWAVAACVTLVPSDQSRGLFDLLDINRDGRLSVREMRGAVKLPEQLDRDAKGHLTREDIPRSYQLTLRRGPSDTGLLTGLAAILDLYRGSGSYGPDRPLTAGPAWFRKMDRNRDGDVSRKEFLFGEETFRKIDADGDGLISPEEAERYDARSREQK